MSNISVPAGLGNKDYHYLLQFLHFPENFKLPLIAGNSSAPSKRAQLFFTLLFWRAWFILTVRDHSKTDELKGLLMFIKLVIYNHHSKRSRDR